MIGMLQPFYTEQGTALYMLAQWALYALANWRMSKAAVKSSTKMTLWLLFFQ